MMLRSDDTGNAQQLPPPPPGVSRETLFSYVSLHIRDLS